VQLAKFGRRLSGTPDAVIGYATTPIHIADAEVVALSGSDIHLVMHGTGNAEDEVQGAVFALTRDELAAADAYETDDYVRVSVTLSSGRRAWAYIGAA
jgi:uncharacterized protein